MSQQRYSPEFKDEAVRQVTEKGHSVQEVAARLGVSSHSLYKWVKAVRPDKDEQRADELLEAKKEILKLRAELRRTAPVRAVRALKSRLSLLFHARRTHRSSLVLGLGAPPPPAAEDGHRNRQ